MSDDWFERAKHPKEWTTPPNQECKSVLELMNEAWRDYPSQDNEGYQPERGSFKSGFFSGYAAASKEKEFEVERAIVSGRMDLLSQAAANTSISSKLQSKLTERDAEIEGYKASMAIRQGVIDALQSQLTAAVEREKVLLEALELIECGGIPKGYSLITSDLVKLKTCIHIATTELAKHREMKGAE